MNWIIGIFIIAWVIISFSIEGISCSHWTVEGDWEFIKTPKDIYRHSKFNIFGCTILWLLVRVISPLATIWLFVYWAFHVGRKDEKHRSKDSF